MIYVQLACEKSHFDHRSGNISNLDENVACAQPSVSQGEEEIPNSNFKHESSKQENERKPVANRIKKVPEDEAQSWAQKELTKKPTPKPWEDKKYYQAIFRKYISIGEDDVEHYDVIDMQIEAQRAVRRITNHQEIVKQYQKVVWAYNNFMQDCPWRAEEA